MEKEGFKVLQDYTKTIAQTNLSMIFGLVALLIGVAALNSNSITEVIPTKAEFYIYYKRYVTIYNFKFSCLVSRLY